ncbi:sigma-54-dependent transcriptional regulator [Desulfoferrobacter suflitae]|uniref:sigma-54-dependent transcriptional regulator n=1 Tax=Desulfoferrobacter suflitae TaxID=2865782 RepID=UPI00216483F0|nr:sigma-54 dependent transcriptional regulator [Desulfoferrobacter suflitae]MCK8604042.1 sigma-54 dependent transcriptional regulator [Desulfoferrobacter suflitae]
MADETLLIIDDEQDMLQLLKRSLEPEMGCSVITASSGEEALNILASEPLDLVLLDMRMPGMDGLEVLQRIRDKHSWLTVIMMTAHGCIETAVQAIKMGAYDFITKPFDHEALVWTLNKALERSRLLRENLKLQRHAHCHQAFQNLVGRSARMQRVYESVQMVAKTDLTVFISGESGTGKDLVSRAIHALSERRDRAYVAVNCPTVPENILESELFGYKKGAFTHASQNKIGLFQEAHGGSIFLDEIGDISPPIQTKLLRVLQEKEIKPLGDTKSIHVDVRVIASTNRNLPDKIRRGEFREDLFYRLNVLPIELPPLRERREDIPLLVDHFLQKHCSDLKKPRKSISAELMDRFLRDPWEGNVRELENVIIRGILFSPEEEIRPEHVGFREATRQTGDVLDETCHELDYREAKEEVLRRFHASYIGNLLANTQGNVTQAAKLCGLERQGLQQIMRRYGIRPDKFRDNTGA